MHQGDPELYPRSRSRLHQQDGVQEADLQEEHDSDHAEEHEEVSVLPRLDLVLPRERHQEVHWAGENMMKIMRI